MFCNFLHFVGYRTVQVTEQLSPSASLKLVRVGHVHAQIRVRLDWCYKCISWRIS